MLKLVIKQEKRNFNGDRMQKKELILYIFCNSIWSLNFLLIPVHCKVEDM